MSDDVIDRAHKLNAYLNQLSADDMTIALAYSTLLRLPLTHPFRLLEAQETLSRMRSWLALRLGQGDEWVQAAFEERARSME